MKTAARGGDDRALQVTHETAPIIRFSRHLSCRTGTDRGGRRSATRRCSGEWWNQRDGFQTLSLYLFADGKGGIFTATNSSKVTATYEKKMGLLRIVADDGTSMFAHDPAARSLTSVDGAYTKWPLKKQRAGLDQFIASHFNPLWALGAKRLDAGKWIIYYRGELERARLTDGSVLLKITGDVFAIDGDSVRIGAELHVAEDGSGSLAFYGAARAWRSPTHGSVSN